MTPRDGGLRCTVIACSRRGPPCHLTPSHRLVLSQGPVALGLVGHNVYEVHYVEREWVEKQADLGHVQYWATVLHHGFSSRMILESDRLLSLNDESAEIH